MYSENHHAQLYNTECCVAVTVIANNLCDDLISVHCFLFHYYYGYTDIYIYSYYSIEYTVVQLHITI